MNQPPIPEIGAAAKPFVKWVGGKRSLIDELLSRAPINFRRYHEPFLGGGAFFFALHNKELLNITGGGGRGCIK